MRKRKTKSLISVILCLTLITSVTGCKASDKVNNYVGIEEQEEMIIQDTEKIYPSEDLQQDKIVSNSNIEAYMKEYNSSASEDTRINYDAIRYDEDERIYYVYDQDKDAGLKFIVGDYGQIISAKVFTGTTNNAGPNLLDMATIALNTFGYSGMSEEDKQALEDVTNRKNEMSSEINSDLALFDGELNLNISLKDSVNHIEIPAKQNLASDNNKNESNEQMSGLLDALKNEAQQAVTSKQEENTPEKSTLPEKEELPEYTAPTQAITTTSQTTPEVTVSSEQEETTSTTNETATEEVKEGFGHDK